MCSQLEGARELRASVWSAPGASRRFRPIENVPLARSAPLRPTFALLAQSGDSRRRTPGAGATIGAAVAFEAFGSE